MACGSCWEPQWRAELEGKSLSHLYPLTQHRAWHTEKCILLREQRITKIKELMGSGNGCSERLSRELRAYRNND